MTLRQNASATKKPDLAERAFMLDEKTAYFPFELMIASDTLFGVSA